jgi:hypothetical protein
LERAARAKEDKMMRRARMSRLSQQLEACARARSTARAHALVRQLRDEFERVRRALLAERDRF